MKIGLFTDTFYPEINGVATSCLNLQRERRRRGHDVHVYAPKCKGWEENQHENVHYLAERAAAGAQRPQFRVSYAADLVGGGEDRL